MQKRLSKYEEWVIDTFKGSNTKDSILLKVNQLLEESNQQKIPIKLSEVAKKIGVNPVPLRNTSQKFEGSLIYQNNKIRISLKNDIYNQRDFRTRFTYAHELIHCLDYQYTFEKDFRIAPLVKKYDELQRVEGLCNYGAAQILLPYSILQKYFLILKKAKEHNIKEIINLICERAKVNTEVLLRQLFNLDSVFKNNSLTIVSQLSSGTDKKGIIKPRSRFSKYIDNEGCTIEFLKLNQGLQHIIGENSKLGSWSLLNFYNDKINFLQVNDEIIINDNTNKTYCINGYHQRIDNNFVWTEMSIQIIE